MDTLINVGRPSRAPVFSAWAPRSAERDQGRSAHAFFFVERFALEGFDEAFVLAGSGFPFALASFAFGR